jgi:hypothetical protein
VIFGLADSTEISPESFGRAVLRRVGSSAAVGRYVPQARPSLREKLPMPKFVTIGYGDRAGYDRTPKDVRDAAHAHEAELQKRGALMGVAGAPVQVRNPLAAGVQRENSAFLSSALPVAGFAVIEAADLSEAIKIVSLTQCAVAHGVVEVWPLEQA